MTAGLTPTTIREYEYEYDRAAPDPGETETETATFGLGCFWGPDARFGATAGIVRTRVGYADGTEPDPTYRSLGDHTEVVQVDVDLSVPSYRDVVETVFGSHDPTREVPGRRYRSAVFADGDASDRRSNASSRTADRRTGWPRERRPSTGSPSPTTTTRSTACGPLPT